MSSITTVQICKDVFEYYFAGFVCKGAAVSRRPRFFLTEDIKILKIFLCFFGELP